MQMLKRIRVAGWKSIKDQTVDLTPLTVVIGANGAGKSNLLSLFKLFNAMFATTPGLRNYVGQSGFADSLLHYGTRQTPVAEMELTFSTETGETSYFARWAAAAGGTLIFTEERVEFLRMGVSRAQVVDLGAGHLGNQPASISGRRRTRQRLSPCDCFGHAVCFIFMTHRTIPLPANRVTSKPIAFFIPMPGTWRRCYTFSGSNIRPLIAESRPRCVRWSPILTGSVLEPSKLNENQILLNWTHKGRDYEFGPHQLSDGSLRFIALATLLLQPEERLPLLIALDEPELGLHPSALEVLSGMAKAASLHSQLVFATQSSVFLDHFEPENIVVVNTRSGTSEFQRLDAEKLEAWRADYTLGEIWEKNVVGGGPYG